MISTFLSKPNSDTLTAISLVAGTIIVVLAAGRALVRLVRNTVRRIAGWITREVKEIFQIEIKPVKDDIAVLKGKVDELGEFVAGSRQKNLDFQETNKKTNLKFHETNVNTLHEIKDIVSELLPNGGSRLRDVIDNMDTNIKKLADPEDKNE